MKIILGITGSISAYKAAPLIRYLKNEGNDVKVIATQSALEFITEETIKTLSGNEAWIDQFGSHVNHIRHIDIREWGDILLIAPATANTCAKIASGIGDDLLTTTAIASLDQIPILMAPSMNAAMYENPIFLENLDRLKKHGIKIVQPDEGSMACGASGKGRLPDPEKIHYAIEDALYPKPLKGVKIVITAGSTVEPIDPARYISNHSSGKTGYFLAKTAALYGGDVHVVLGKTDVSFKYLPVKTIHAKTAREMEEAFFRLYGDCAAAICAAAVADYRAKKTFKNKIKKQESFNLELIKNPDILARAGKEKKVGQVLTGFSLETENEIENGKKKKELKNCDFMVINNPTRKGSEFGGDTNEITVLGPQGRYKSYPSQSKEQCAKIIWDEIIKETRRESGI